MSANIDVISAPVKAMLNVGISQGWITERRLKETLRSIKATQNYAAALRKILFELDVEVRTSDFEYLLVADAILVDGKTDNLETINEAADLLATLLECDIEEQYLADVRALRDDAISLQPIR